MSDRRRGFSLIELLVVIGVIAVLASLSIVVMGNLLDQAREDATASTIAKVNGLLEERITAFDRAFSNTVQTDAAEELQRQLRVAIGLPTSSVVDPLRNTGVAEVLARKWVYKQAFPQTFAELITTGGGTPDANSVVRPDLLAQQYPSVDWARHDATPENRATESAEVLHFMLTEMAVFGVTPVGADAFNSGEVADTDGDGLPEFIDAWGNPLRFYRWPTRLLDRDYWTDSSGTFSPPLAADTFLYDRNERQITTAERQLAGLLVRGLPAYFPGGDLSLAHRDALLTDPDDPNGALASEFLVLPGAGDGTGGLRVLFNEGTFHSLDVYHTPLIVSAGGDGLLGLWEPWEVRYDLNWSAAGSVDDNDAGGIGSPDDEDRVIDTTPHDVVLGNLAQVLDDDGMETKYGSVFSIADLLSDNITNRNRRAGGSN